MSFNWICLICEKPVEVLCSGSDKSPFSYPAIAGGTLELDFGYGSQYDNLQTGEKWQGCVCEECFEKKKHLTRPVVMTKENMWKLKNASEQSSD